jgi:hypothetical protein
MHVRLVEKKIERRNHLGKIDIDRRIIFSWILRKENKNVDWIHSRQNRDQWPTFVNTVMNITFTYIAVKLCTS